MGFRGEVGYDTVPWSREMWRPVIRMLNRYSGGFELKLLLSYTVAG